MDFKELFDRHGVDFLWSMSRSNLETCASELVIKEHHVEFDYFDLPISIKVWWEIDGSLAVEMRVVDTLLEDGYRFTLSGTKVESIRLCGNWGQSSLNELESKFRLISGAFGMYLISLASDGSFIATMRANSSVSECIFAELGRRYA